MADNEYERTKKELELREKIKESVKEATASMQSFADAQKEVAKNYKLIKSLSAEIANNEARINELANATEEALVKEREDLKKINEGIKQQKALYIGINKELSKTVSLFKSAGNQMIQWGKQIKGNIVPSLSDMFTKFLDIDNLVHQTANTLGFQGTKLALMKGNVSSVVEEYAAMGYSIEDAYAVQTSLSDATGRQVMLTRDATKALVESARITGMMPADMANLTGQMEAFGLGAEQSADFIFKMSKESSDMGLNSGKVIKKFQENLGLLNKLNFKNGIKGLKEMAKFSEKYKLDMNAVASVADKVFRPEGAIEAAAQLQVLGGSLASLGDPFQLMYKARNSPEELAKSLTKAATASATFDKTTKEWKVNAYELDRLKEAANALGMDYTQLAETAKQAAKIKSFEGILAGKGMDPQMMDAITGMAQMGENGAFVTIKGEPKLLKDLDSTQAKLLMDQEKERAKIADTAKSLNNRIDEIKNKFIIAGVKIFDKLEPLMKDLLKFGNWLVDKLNPTNILLAFAALPILKGAWWIIQGRIFGMSAAAAINAGTIGKGGGGKGMIGKIKGLFTKTTPATPETGIPATNGLPTQSAPTEEMAKSTKSFGDAAGMSAGKILALGAALLMVGGAIWLASDGLSHLVTAFAGLTGPQALGALGAVVAVMGGFVAIIYAMVPAITALGVAGTAGSIGLLAIGAAFLMIGGAVALVGYGISMIVDSFSEMFKVIGANGSSLIMAGLGFMSMAAGIGLLSVAMLALAGTSLLALPGLLMLGGVTSMLTETATALQASGGSDGITKTIDAINKVDTSKLDALKDLSMWMALLGGTTTVKFDESLHVDGSIEIAGQAGGKSNTDWVKDPIFLSKLKQLLSEKTATDRNGK